MKKKLIDFCSFSILCIFLSLQFSCEKNNSSLQPEFNDEVQQSEVTQKGQNNCSLNLNDMDISILWSNDCSTATITFDLCCHCKQGPITGCFIPNGTIEIQTEECPFQFYNYQQAMPQGAIREDLCRPITFDITNKGCDQVFVSQIWLNGANLDVDNNYSDQFCP